MNAIKKLFTWSVPSASKELGDYSNKERNYFLLGMFGQNLIYTIISAALSLFYTDVLIVDIAVVGVIFTLARVWDAVNDPIMGMVMERTHTRWGKCRPYLKYIPLPVAIVTILLFMPISGWSMGWKIFYLTLMYFLWSPVYTMCDIPLWSLPSRMIPDEERRTKTIAAARIVGSIAGVLTAIYAPIKNALGKLDLGMFEHVGLPGYDGFFSQEQGYLLATLIICIIGAILFKTIFPNVRERVDVGSGKTLTVKENLKLIAENKPFLRIVVSGVLGCTKMLLLTAGMYFCKWVMGNGNEGMWVVVLGAPYLVGSMIAIAITPKLGDRYTKEKLYKYSSFLSAIPVVIMFFMMFTNLENMMSAYMLTTAIICLLAFGFLSSFSMVLQPAMIADSVDYLEWKKGERADGIFFSGLTFINKLMSGIAILISNVLLGLVAYTDTIDILSKQIKEATAAGGTFELDFAAEYPQITLMMFILITIVPAIGCVLQALPMLKYELTDERLKEIRTENDARRAAEKAATENEISDEVATEGAAE